MQRVKLNRRPKRPGIRRLLGASRRTVSIIPHAHRRLILDVVEKTPTDFSSSREPVKAVQDALINWWVARYIMISPPGHQPRASRVATF